MNDKISNDWKTGQMCGGHVFFCLTGLLLMCFCVAAQAVDITWAGDEYTSLTVTGKVGDISDFEIQTYPNDTDGNGAELQIDWDYSGTWAMDNYYGMSENGTFVNNRKWWKSQRMLYAGDHARKYKAYSPDYWVPAIDSVYTFSIADLDGATNCYVADEFGPEMLKVYWTKPTSFNVMVVRRAGGAPDAPVAETVYAAGNTYGTDSRNTVVYAAGSGNSLTDYGLNPTTTYYYAFFAVNNNCYSADKGTVKSDESMSAATASFQTNLLAEDSFAYTPITVLSGKNGGNGWSGGWSSASFSVQNGSFDSWTGFPTNYGNKVRVTPANDTVETAVRSFSAVTGGTVYISYIMNYEYSGTGKFVGLSLMSNGTERAFFGEISAEDQLLGLSTYDDSGSSTHSTYTLTAGSGHDYLVVGAYNFDTREFKAKAFADGVSIPGPEPETWDVSVTLDSGRIESINGIRLGAGEVDGGTSGTPGNCYFDEVRIATSWADLVNRLEVAKKRKTVPVFFLRGLR